MTGSARIHCSLVVWQFKMPRPLPGSALHGPSQLQWGRGLFRLSLQGRPRHSRLVAVAGLEGAGRALAVRS